MYTCFKLYQINEFQKTFIFNNLFTTKIKGQTVAMGKKNGGEIGVKTVMLQQQLCLRE